MCPAAVKFSCLCSEAALYGLLHNFPVFTDAQCQFTKSEAQGHFTVEQG